MYWTIMAEESSLRNTKEYIEPSTTENSWSLLFAFNLRDKCIWVQKLDLSYVYVLDLVIISLPETSQILLIYMLVMLQKICFYY